MSLMLAAETTWSVTVPTPLPDLAVPTVTGVVALLASIAALTPQTTRIRRVVFALNVFGTIVHEAGHATAGIITGGGVYVIEVDTPHSGVTYTWHYSRLAEFAVKLAGYATPPLAGLGAASLLSRGHAPMVLALTTAVMVLILLVTRDPVTFLSVVAVGLVAFAALTWAPVWVQHWVAYTETWLLLFSQFTGVWFLVHRRIHHDVDDTDDALGLADLTGVPGFVWIAGWAALNGWALWNAVPLLWP